MPADVDDNLRRQGFLKSVGPHAPATVRRRLANWSTLTKWRGLDGAFASPALKSAIRPRPCAPCHDNGRRKSAKAVTGDVLAKLLATCATDSLRDLRDRAILMVAFASGGRRRSEIAGLRREQLTVEPPISSRRMALPSLAIHLGRAKTTTGEQDEVVYLTGRPVEALERLAGGRQDRQGQRVSGDRAMGHRVAASARSAVGQCDPQAAGGDGRVGQWGIFRRTGFDQAI